MRDHRLPKFLKHNMAKKIIIFILLIVLSAGVFYYKDRFGRWPWQGQVQESNELKTQPSDEDSNVPVAPAEKSDRETIMEDVAARISRISPVKSSYASEWKVERFWFIKDSDVNFYVEYGDGKLMRRLLLEASGQGSSLSYKVAAYFEPGESDWTQKNGQDDQFGQPMELYLLDKGSNSWVKAVK